MTNTRHQVLASRGQRIQAAIQASPYAQGEVAAKLKISRQALSDVVCGRAPGEKHLATLAAMLEVPEAWLRDGGPTPKGVDQCHGSSVLPNTPEVRAFLHLAKDGLLAWRRLEKSDPGQHGRLLARLPAALRHHIEKQGGPPGPMQVPVEAHIAAFRSVDVQAETYGLADLTAGYEAIKQAFAIRRQILSQRDAPKDAGPDLSLPPALFATTRGALVTLRGERRTFGRSSEEFDEALAELWRRQLTRRWSADIQARLEAERAGDLGNAHAAPSST